MLIGVDQNSNTTIHCCEELAEVDYHLQQEATESVVTGYDGVEIPVRNRLHEWGKPPTDFNKFDERLERSGIMWIGSVGESTIRLIRAHEMVEFCVETLGREPHFLLV